MSTPSIPKRLAEHEADLRRRSDLVDALLSEKLHHAVIVADQDAAGGVDELTRADYLAARERWEVATRDFEVAQTEAAVDRSLETVRAELASRRAHPSRFKLIPGGQIGADS